MICLRGLAIILLSKSEDQQRILSSHRFLSRESVRMRIHTEVFFSSVIIIFGEAASSQKIIHKRVKPNNEQLFLRVTTLANSLYLLALSLSADDHMGSAYWATEDL